MVFRITFVGQLLLGAIYRPALARLAALARVRTRGARQLWEPLLERQFSLGARQLT